MKWVPNFSMTVFLTNCNRMKGNLFGGATSTSDSRFRALEAGAGQLLNVREVGIIFGYMSLDAVWDAYCDVYDGMLDLFETFDPWYKQQSQKTSDLAGLWPKFIREELDMIVKRGRDDMKRMNNMRKPAANHDALWDIIMKGPNAEMHKVRLDKDLKVQEAACYHSSSVEVF